MEDDMRRKVLIAGFLIVGLGIGGLLNYENSSPPSGPADGDSWRTVELTDVREGESYSIDSLEKPVLLETFAVWCPTCTRQQQEIKELHGDVNFTSVSLNVDQNENADKIRSHIQSNGFDWRYSIAPATLTQKLIREFDPSMAQPPSAPVVLVCENSSRKLKNGVKPASKLEEEIRKGC